MKTLPRIESRSGELLTTVAFKKYNPNTSQGDISLKTQPIKSLLKSCTSFMKNKQQTRLKNKAA